MQAPPGARSYLARMAHHPQKPLRWSSHWHLPAGHLQVKGPRTPPAQRSRRPSHPDADAAEPKDASFAELHTPTMSAYHAMVHAYSVAGDLRCALSSPANSTRITPSHVVVHLLSLHGQEVLRSAFPSLSSAERTDCHLTCTVVYSL